MRKNRVLEYMNGKRYYLSFLGCLIVTIVAISVIYVKTQQNKEIANLNEVIPEAEMVEIAESEPEITVAVIEEIPTITESLITVHEEDVIGNEEITDEITEGALETEVVEAFANEEAVQKDEIYVDSVDIIENANVAELAEPAASFDPATKMLLPLTGDILMEYSTETPVYFETLNQYRLNTTLRIKAEVGTEVMAAADGVVEEIKTDYAKGNVVIINHGNGYKTVYSQLQEDMNVKVGETVEKGDGIGFVAEPSSYFVLEGSHLCFEVLLNDQPINPEDLL